MKIKAFTIFFALCIGTTLSSFAQDPSFSQFFSNPMCLNPAYAGTSGGSRIATSYRNQWPSTMVYSASYDQPISFLSGGVGINFMSDYAEGGAIISNMINGTYAYNFKIGETLHLRPALNFGYGHKSFDASKIFGYEYAPNSNVHLEIKDGSTKYFNFGTGLLVAYKKMTFGFSIDHLNTPEVGFISISKLSRKFTLHGNYQFDFTEKIKLTSGLIYQQQTKFQTILPSLMLKINHLKIGAASRFNVDNFYTVIGMIGYGNKWMNLGYSYDFNFSKWTNVIGGAHEISAIFMFNHKEKNENQKIVPFEGF